MGGPTTPLVYCPFYRGKGGGPPQVKQAKGPTSRGDKFRQIGGGQRLEEGPTTCGGANIDLGVKDLRSESVSDEEADVARLGIQGTRARPGTIRVPSLPAEGGRGGPSPMGAAGGSEGLEAVNGHIHTNLT